MCGLVGIVNKGRNGMTNDQVKAFAELLYSDQLRGVDGTGIFYNAKKNEKRVKILKAPYKSSLFVQTKEFQDAADTMFKESNFAIGHNRAATKGKVDGKCTHPFREQHIVLVHNGTISDHKELHDDKDVEVDSHAICHSIAKIGAKETLKKIDGAFALIWFDGKEGTLNLCRNYQRPLFMLEFGSGFMFVSEEELGKWIAKRNNINITKSFQLEPKKLYKFDIDDMSKYEVEDVEYKQYQPTVYNKPSWVDSYPTYSNKHKKYSFGQLVRFKGGLIRPSNIGRFLEGDICNYNFLDTDKLNDGDFEDEYRIKVIGTDNELLKFVGKDLVGRISQTHVYGNQTTYVVTDVELWHQDSFKFKQEKKETGKKCDGCGKEVTGVAGQIIQGIFCCPSCVSDFLFEFPASNVN